MKISVITTGLFSRSCHWLRERFHKRRAWLLVAVLFFIAEMALLVWPVGWLKEDRDNALLGQGSWNMEHQGDHFSCSQEFFATLSSEEFILFAFSYMESCRCSINVLN